MKMSGSEAIHQASGDYIPDQRKRLHCDYVRRQLSLTGLVNTLEYGLLKQNQAIIESVKRTTHEYGTNGYHKVRSPTNKTSSLLG